MFNQKSLSEQGDDQRELSVLVVDDFEAMARMLANSFESLGYKSVYRAKDGKDALAKLEKITVDLIVSDWNMPRMNGLELLQHIRSDPETKHIPFIMVTGNIQQSDVVEAINAGVSEYLIKPFNQVMLQERVHKAFVSPIPQNSVMKKKTEDKTKAARQNSILIVDDEPNNIMVLGELLKGKYKIQACRSGKKALEICAMADKPDMILLDIMMPEMDGIEVCRRLKENPETEHIPVIFVSALSETDDVVKGLKLGAVDYVTKPIVPEIVLARIQTHMNTIKQREKMVEQMDTLIENIRIRDEVDRTFQHDIRNPLSALHLTLPSLQAKHPDSSDEIAMLEDISNVALSMLNNKNMLAELEQGAFDAELSQINAHNMIKRVASSYKALCQENQTVIRLNVDPQHHYLGDDLLSYNLFSNLIKNAIEAAPEKSNITITSGQGEEHIVIAIHNLGSVPLKIRPKFFDKFVTEGKDNGAGIGAYSARLCAYAQSGQIKLESSDEKGTTLVIKFKALMAV